jgi:hypothetical protein
VCNSSQRRLEPLATSVAALHQLLGVSFNTEYSQPAQVGALLASSDILTETRRSAKSLKQHQRHGWNLHRHWSSTRWWQLGAHRKPAASCRQSSAASYCQRASSQQLRGGILRHRPQQQWPIPGCFALCTSATAPGLRHRVRPPIMPSLSATAFSHSP